MTVAELDPITESRLYDSSKQPRSVLIVIPARMASTRFPGKPLTEINGKPLLWYVYERAKQAMADRVLVTSPDKEIRDYCQANDIGFWPSSVAEPTGTHRCAAVLRQKRSMYDVVVDWQCDEPLVDPAYVDAAVKACGNPYSIVTLTAPQQFDAMGDPNVVKVVCNHKRCLWFSRASRFGNMLHCGIYIYTAPTLLELSQHWPTECSKDESLEQLTWLEANYPIGYVGMPELPPSVNVPEDLEKIRPYLC